MRAIVVRRHTPFAIVIPAHQHMIDVDPALATSSGRPHLFSRNRAGDHPASRRPNRLRSSLLVLKPLTERLDFRRRVRRKKVIDVDVGRRDQDGLGMCHGVEAIFAVVVSDP
jgi:hypothetical protein